MQKRVWGMGVLRMSQIQSLPYRHRQPQEQEQEQQYYYFIEAQYSEINLIDGNDIEYDIAFKEIRAALTGCFQHDVRRHA